MDSTRCRTSDMGISVKAKSQYPESPAVLDLKLHDAATLIAAPCNFLAHIVLSLNRSAQASWARANHHLQLPPFSFLSVLRQPEIVVFEKMGALLQVWGCRGLITERDLKRQARSRDSFGMISQNPSNTSLQRVFSMCYSYY